MASTNFNGGGMSTNSTNRESGKFLRQQQVAQARKGSKNDLDNKIKMLN
jgi:hypothetical protein